MGINNQMGRYIKNSKWLWGETQQQAFTEINKALSTAPTLAIYDPAKEIEVAADTSSYGLCSVNSS